MYRKIFLTILVVFSILLVINCSNNGGVKNNNPKSLSQEQLNKIAVLIRTTETDPFSKKSMDMRMELFMWLTESPDVSVMVFDVLKIEEDYEYNNMFLFQSLITPARIIIENPDIKKDNYEIQLRTTNKLLDIYKRLIIEKGISAKSKQIDKIVALKENGQLEGYIRDIVNK